FIHPTFGKYEKGVEAARKLIELDPDFSIGYLQVAFNSQFAGRLEDAGKTLRQAAERKLEIPDLAATRYDILFLKGDRAGMDREVIQAQRTSGPDDLVSARYGFVLAYAGRLKEAKSMARRVADANQEPAQRGKRALFELGPPLW